MILPLLFGLFLSLSAYAQQVSVKDIARELGVSPSTVSRALKDNPDISQETRDAIHKYAGNVFDGDLRFTHGTYWFSAKGK